VPFRHPANLVVSDAPAWPIRHHHPHLRQGGAPCQQL